VFLVKLPGDSAAAKRAWCCNNANLDKSKPHQCCAGGFCCPRGTACCAVDWSNSTAKDCCTADERCIAGRCVVRRKELAGEEEARVAGEEVQADEEREAGQATDL
jgi:hypothetical protein